MRKQSLSSAVALIVAALLPLAPGQVGAQDEERTIAVIPLSLGHPWWVRAEVGAMRAGEELGIEVIFTAPETEDAARQVDVFNDMVSRGVDAIVLAAVDSKTMMRPVQQAVEAGIAVFGFDVGAPGTDVLFTASGWEPTQSGRNIGEGLAHEIGGEGKVAILTGGLGSPFLTERQQAIEAVLAEYPDIEVVGVFANDNEYEKALSQAESVLQANPDFAGFASTVTTGVPAAAQAVANAGRSGDVAIWGVALPKQNAEAIRKGYIKGALGLDPAQMTYLGVRMANDYLEDGTLPQEGRGYGWAGTPIFEMKEKFAYVPDVLLTADNVGQFDF
jgi:rhamnose transport system substrate-binding protein